MQRPEPYRPAGGAWERLENLDRAEPAAVPRPFGPGRPSPLGAWSAGAIPLLALLVAWIFLRAVPCSGKACVVPGAAGWGAGLLAIPTAPIAGLPWQSGPLPIAIAAASSVAVWILIGVWATRRAGDGGGVIRQVLWLGGAVWLGSLVGLLVGTLALAA
ncbi:MAG: hypothetical protein JWL70_972 [Acidimicrobiia bacterium]|nr:hypothetical protein [Acidimicrobiia bacterium]